MSSTKSALKIAALTACLLALFACTEKTYITNSAPDQRPPLVEWVSVGMQTTPPSIEEGDFGHPPLTPPASGGGTASVVSDSVALTISATDESGIDSVKLYVNGFQRFRATPPAPPSIEGGVFAFSWNTLSDSDGVYSLEARAWDKAGNVGVSPALTLRVANTTPPLPPDRTPPRIRIHSPEPGSVIRNEFELQFTVMDSSRLDSILIFVDGEIGQILAAGDDSLYIAHMNSSRWSNGRRIIEVRAYDAAGNIGISNPLGLTIDNHRVIWVPDDFETIQGAINASVDGDTVMVRAGTYNESLQMFDKMVSLISESGPEMTIIDATIPEFLCLTITGGQDSTVLIRGFTFFRNVADQASCVYISGSGPKIMNNIMSGGAEITGLYTDNNAAIVHNNLFIDIGLSTQMSYSWGNFVIT